ncbi:HCLS1-associated protein X-1 [Hetaerina americana]|uniref:HCLS1-associated protein X-1 n=1 Tax=Hetaerina americana TaxID=62018 RepID=UPI003A7F21AF
MSLYDFMKNIFGFPRSHTPVDPSTSDPSNGSEFKKPVWYEEYGDEDDDILSQQQGPPMFPVLSDPLEIHRYFEQQMEHMQQMLKNFSMFSHSSIFDESHPKSFGAIESPDTGSQSLRDEYLKQSDGTTPIIRKDADLDSRVGAEGLGGILDDPLPEQRIVPTIPAPKFRFFGESIITQTVRKPDGTVETRTTKKRSDGTEETVVSVQKADGSEDVHTQTDLLPRGGMDPFSRRSDDMIFDDLFSNFFGRR